MKTIKFTLNLILLAQISTAQNWQWAKQMGSNYQFYDDFIESLITDDTNIYVIGSFGGTFYLPGDTLFSFGNNSTIIVYHKQRTYKN